MLDQDGGISGASSPQVNAGLEKSPHKELLLSKLSSADAAANDEESYNIQCSETINSDDMRTKGVEQTSSHLEGTQSIITQ